MTELRKRAQAWLKSVDYGETGSKDYARWAKSVRPGDRVGVYNPNPKYGFPVYVVTEAKARTLAIGKGPHGRRFFSRKDGRVADGRGSKRSVLVPAGDGEDSAETPSHA